MIRIGYNIQTDSMVKDLYLINKMVKDLYPINKIVNLSKLKNQRCVKRACLNLGLRRPIYPIELFASKEGLYDSLL